MTKIKICGLRRPEDIAYVNEARPDFAGFIIDVPKSRRNVSPEKVRELTALLSPEILPVGVFVNAPMETILSLVTDGTLKAVQLHGQESQSYLEELKKQRHSILEQKRTGRYRTGSGILFSADTCL